MDKKTLHFILLSAITKAGAIAKIVSKKQSAQACFNGGPA
jgi:hypothetical protein